MSEIADNNYTPECGALVRYVGHHMEYGLQCGDTGIYVGAAPKDAIMRGEITAMQWFMKYGKRPHGIKKNGEMYFVVREDLEPVDDYDGMTPTTWDQCEWQPPKSETEGS